MSIDNRNNTSYADTAPPLGTIDQRVERGRATDRAHDGAIVPFPPNRSVVGSLGGNLAKEHESLLFDGYRLTEYRYRNAAEETIQVVLRYDHKEHPLTNPHQPDPAARSRYFGEMTEQMETGGYGAMLGQLLRRDVSRWNPELIPETPALVRQKQLSLHHDPVQSYLFDRLTDGVNITSREDGSGRPIHLWSETEIAEVPVGELKADYRAYRDAEGMTYSERMLTTHLPRYMPEGFASVVRRERDAVDRSTVRLYPFPPLEVARHRFEEVTRMAIPRDETAEE